MAWTPPSDAVEAKSPAWTPPADAVISTKPAAPAATVAEPEFLMPGSKSEAALRAFSQGATLGYGDEIQALIRSIGSDKTYTQLRDEERAANEAAKKAHGTISTVANIAGAAPSYLAAGGAGIVRNALGTGAVSGIQGLGGAEGSAGEQLLEAGKAAAVGTALGGAAGAVNKGAGIVADTLKTAVRPTPTLAESIAATARSGGGSKAADALKHFQEASAKHTAATNTLGSKAVQTLTGAALGGATAPLVGADWRSGALLGALGVGGAGKLAKNVLASPAAKPIYNQMGNVARIGQAATGPAATAAATSATVQALQSMSKRQSTSVVQAGDAKIQERVEAGQPEYAAQFQQLQDPAYRKASSNLKDDDEDDEDDEE